MATKHASVAPTPITAARLLKQRWATLLAHMRILNEVWIEAQQTRRDLARRYWFIEF